MDIKIFLRKYWCWLFIALLYWVVGLMSMRHDYFDYGGDSAQYIIVAESLIAGKGYVMSNYPGDPISFLYPPVFPTLLAPVLYFFGRNFSAIYFLIALFGFGAIVLAYKLFRPYVGKVPASLAVFLLAVNGIYCRYCFSFIRSEAVYIFFVFLALLFLEKYRQSDKSYFGWCLGFSLCLVYFTRYAGITLILGILLSLVIERVDWRKLFLPLVIFLVPFCAWNIWKICYKTYTVSQVDLLLHGGGYLIRIWNGLNYYSGELTHMLFPEWICSNIFIYVLLSLGLVVVIVYGLVNIFKKRCLLGVNIYLIIYLTLILLWPAKESENGRFLIPLLPVLFFYLFFGIGQAVKNTILRVVCVIFLIIPSLTFIPGRIAWGSAKLNPPSSLLDYKVASIWLKNNSLKEDVIMARKPTVTSFYSGRKAVLFEYAADNDLIWQQIIRDKVNYIIVDNFSQYSAMYLVPAILRYPKRVKPVYLLSNAAVFQVIYPFDGTGE